MVPKGHVEDGFNLGIWIANRRKDHKSGRLSHERVARLEALPGWVWGARASRK